MTAISGIEPAAKPITSKRPSGASARRPAMKASPPTESTTTSTPRPSVRSRASAPQSPLPLRIVVAPADRAAACVASLLATAITFAPSASATWIEAVPTPPPAPRIRTVSPGCTAPRRWSAKTAVWVFITSPAAASKLSESGIGKVKRSGATASSAKPPRPVIAATRSPGERLDPSGAVFTTPDTSTPGMNGSSGFIW